MLRFLHLLFYSALFISYIGVNAQVQTAKYVSMNSNTNAYYEYLPQGYNSATHDRYPLLLSIHGVGQLGNGTAASLPAVLQAGPPMLINQDRFPDSFTANGQTFRFIVISPQFIKWPEFTDIDEVLDYIEAHYKVDPARIYVTGTSMGGGVTWEYGGCTSNLKYVQRIAGIVPVCGASYPAPGRARTIAKYNLPVWAFHNNDDPTVPVSYTNDYVSEINQAPAPVPRAKKTIFNASGHDAWTKAYDPAYKEGGMNVYEWMLQYSRPGNAEGPLPVILSDYEVVQTNTGKVQVSWTTSFEQDNAYFTVERSVDGTNFLQLDRVFATNSSSGSRYTYIDKFPLEGEGYYQLSQTDKDGKTTRFRIIMVKTGKVSERALKIYPNPAADHIDLTWRTPQMGQVRVSILSQDGKILYSEYFSKQQPVWQQRIGVSRLDAGYYIVEIKDAAGGTYISRFIKK